MKKLFIGAYILFGSLNALFFGLMMYVGFDLVWSPITIVVSVFFFLIAVLLMRAPFSERNIDRLAVSIFRFVALVFFACLEYGMVKLSIDEGSEPVGDVIIGVVPVTMILVAAMPAVRRRFFRSQD